MLHTHIFLLWNAYGSHCFRNGHPLSQPSEIWQRDSPFHMERNPEKCQSNQREQKRYEGRKERLGGEHFNLRAFGGGVGEASNHFS